MAWVLGLGLLVTVLADLIQLCSTRSGGCTGTNCCFCPKGRRAVIDYVTQQPWPNPVLRSSRDSDGSIITLNKQQRRAHEEVSRLTPLPVAELKDLVQAAINDYLVRRAMLVQRLEVQRSLPFLLVDHSSLSTMQRLETARLFEAQWIEGQMGCDTFHRTSTPPSIDGYRVSQKLCSVFASCRNAGRSSRPELLADGR